MPNQWTKLTDKMPGAGDPVWGCWMDKEDVYYDHVVFDGRDWWNCNSSNHCQAPTHWQPIVEPER